MAINKGNILCLFGVKGGIGKSILAMNLAGVASNLKRKVLIVDADLYGGSIALAEKVVHTLETKESHFAPLYADDLSLKEKIETIAKEIYGADGVEYEPAALKQLTKITEMGYGNCPICMAKNQYSLSDDASLLGRPANFKIHIREVYLNAGAGFVVALTGAIMTMPGLPKVPAANGIDVNEEGVITGLF